LAILALATFSFATNSSAFTLEKVYNGSAGRGDLPFSFQKPVSIFIDSDGLMYVSDDSASAIYALDENDAVVRSIGKKGASSELSNPTASWYDGQKTYITDSGLAGIYYDVKGTGIVRMNVISPFLTNPSALWVEGGGIWILDKAKNKVYAYNISLDKYEGTYLSEGFGDGKLSSPSDLFFDGERFYIADTGNNRVQVFSKNFEYLSVIGTGKGGLSLNGPKSAASDGKRVYVADTYNKRIIVFDLQGFVLDEFDEAIAGNISFQNPVSVRVKDEKLYVVDGSLAEVFVYSINWSASTQNLFSELISANTTVQNYNRTTIALAKGMGAQISAYALGSNMQTAFSYFEAGDYAKARKELSDTLELLEARKKADTKAMESALLSKIDSASKSAQYYNGASLTLSQQEKLAEAQSSIDAAKAALASKNYKTSLSFADLASSSLESIANAPASPPANNTGSGQSEPASGTLRIMVQAQADRANLSLSSLQQRAQMLGIYINFEPVPSLIQSANALLEVSQFDEAKASLEAAQARLDEISASMDANEAQIIEANITLSQALKASAASGSAEAMAKAEEARIMLFENPQQAQALARESIQLSNSGGAMLELSPLALALIAFVAILFSVAILGAAAFILIKSRQKGLAGAGEKFSAPKIELKIDLGGRRKKGL